VSQPQTETSRKVVTSARVQACALSDVSCAAPVNANANKTARGAGQVRAGAAVGPTAVSGSRSEAVDSVDDGDLVALFDDATEPRVRHTADGVRRGSPGIVAGEARTYEKGTGRDVSSSSSSSRIFYSSKVANDVNKPGDEYDGVCHTSVMNEKPMSSQLIVDNLAPLQYVRIPIDGLDGDFVALHDSGSQINLIRRSLLPDDQQQSVGKIGIRRAFGASIQTEVVMRAIKPAVHENYEVNVAPAYETLLAVCEELNEQIILTADTVRHLNSCQVSTVPDEVVVDDDDKSSQDDDVILPLDGNSYPVVSLSVDDVSHQYVDEPRDQSDVVVSDDNFRSADSIILLNEQLADPALSKYWDLARNEKGGLFIRDGLLYRHGYVNGEKVIQLYLPETRVNTVLKLAHDMPFGSHMAFRRTNDRISASFFFPGQRARVKDHCMRCETCQLFAPARRSDLNTYIHTLHTYIHT
jgi:hypothetical protein